MKFLIPAVSFAVGASGATLVSRQSGCCFQVNVGGGPGTGPLGQYTDGQNRVGTGYSAATYCINNGVIIDSAGRGCILTPPTTQFQCDTGAAGTAGFSVGTGGAISYNGNTQFYECVVAPGIWNIYTTPGGTQCSPITLATAGGTCAPATSLLVTPTVAPTPAPAPTVTVTAPGFSTTATVTGPCSPVTATITGPAVTATQTVAGPTVTATAPGSTVSVAGPTVTKTAVQTTTLPGSVTTVTSTLIGSCTPNTVTMSTIKTVTAIASCTPSVVTQTTTVQGPGSTLTVVASCTPSVITQITTVQAPGSTITKTAPGTTVTVTAPAPGPVTVTAPAPGPVTVTAPAPGPVTITAPAPGPATITSVTSIPVTVTKTVPPSSPSAKTCPTNIPNTNFQFPHLIVPVSSSSPDTAYGTSYNGIVNSTTSSIFNFDIPASYQGTTCTLVFLLPAANTLQTSSYTLTGAGSISVVQLSGPASAGTTFNNQPGVAKDLGSFPVTAGSSTVIATGACAAGQAMAYELRATGSLALSYFQDYNAPAVGLYITEC